MIKTIVIFIIVIAVFSGVYYLLPEYEVDDAQTVEVKNEISTDAQEYFNEKLQTGVIENIGQPIEGFRPRMFLQAFLGLVPSDFDGAEALLGDYKMVEKELTFIMDTSGPIHSAAEAISDEGMKTVLLNISKRTGTLFTNKSEIDGLLLFLGGSFVENVFECAPEQRDADVCIEIYQPVCGLVNVQCITTPCPPIEQTFSNSCEACRNSLVDVYTDGACAID